MTTLFKSNNNNNNSIECICYNTHTMPFPVKLHWHYYSEIILVTKGKIILNIDKQCYDMDTGDFIFIFPESVHNISTVNGNDAEFIIVKFDLEKIPLLLNNVSNRNIIAYAQKKNVKVHFNNNIISRNNINNIVIKCLEEFDIKNWGYEMIIQNNIHTVLVFLIRLWKKTDDFCFGDIVNKKIDYKFSNITEYIDNHTNENISVNDIAKLCDMSYSHFARTFREIYGMSCKTYINKIRMMKVENLLVCTNHDLNYISQETGFSDCSHMIRVFKKLHNMTPNEFRKKAKLTEA